MVLPPCDQYYDQLHPDQLSLNSRPPTSTQHDVQQQSDHPVRCTPTFTPQQDLASSTRLFDSSTSSPHNSLVHRSTPSLSKSSRSAPYPKAVQLDTSQTAQDESDASAIRAQRVLQAAPRKRPAARTQHRLSSDLPATPEYVLSPLFDIGNSLMMMSLTVLLSNRTLAVTRAAGQSIHPKVLLVTRLRVVSPIISKRSIWMT
ncbi:hypothetical protein J3A83DRAFT_2010397 [Scleroderma citrinum]